MANDMSDRKSAGETEKCIPSNIRRLRDEHGWTYQQMANMLGGSHGVYSRALIDNEVSKVYELSALHYLSWTESLKAKTSEFYSLSVPADKADKFATLCNILDLTPVKID